jgi:hypothetical protein
MQVPLLVGESSRRYFNSSTTYGSKRATPDRVDVNGIDYSIAASTISFDPARPSYVERVYANVRYVEQQRCPGEQL